MAFFLPTPTGYAATELTRGPWDAASQHAGPPCALLGRELERAGELEHARLTRLTFEILGPVPIAELTVSAHVVRPGRSVELIEGELRGGERTLIKARAWRIREKPVSESAPPTDSRLPAPESCAAGVFFPTGQEVGYHTAMESRFASGAYREPGPARAWLRMRETLVEGETPSPIDRLLVAADSGNGVSAPLDYERFLFINADLSVAVLREPAGEWIGLDASTATTDDGIGLTRTTLHDRDGVAATATQSLLIADRD